MRLIDADALIEKCGEWYTEEGPEEGYIGPLKHLLNKQPTIEPKQGGWIHRSYYRPSTKMYDCEMYVCNKCRYECSHDAETGRSAGSYNFCPNCGARMKGENEQ